MSSTSSYRPSGIYSAQWLPTDAAGRLERVALDAHLAFVDASPSCTAVRLRR
jgi:hypothetical protein